MDQNQTPDRSQKLADLLVEFIKEVLKEHLTVNVDRPRKKHPAGFHYYGPYQIEIGFAGETIATAQLPEFAEKED